MNRERARWFYISLPVLVFWIVASIDKLGVSIIVTNDGFLKDMGLVGHPAAIGLLGTIFSVAYGSCAIVWGFFVDRIGPRIAGVTSAALWGITLILGGIANSFAIVLTSRLLLGVGEGALYPVSHKFVGNWFDRPRRARAQSLWVLGGPLGPVIGVPILVFTMQAWGWRGAFFLLAAISLFIVMPALYIFTRDAPTPGAPPGPKHSEGRAVARPSMTREGAPLTVHELLSGFRFWTVVVIFLVTGFGFTGLSFWLPTYLRTARHFPAQAMAGWTSASWLLAVVGVIITGWLADRTQRPGLLGGLVFTLGAAVLAIAALTDNPTLAAAMLAIGLATINCASTLCQVLMLHTAGPQFVGRGAGIMAGIGNLIGGFGPVIIGEIVAMSDGSYIAGVLFLVVCLAIGAIGFFFLAATGNELSTSRAAAALP